MNFGGFQFGQSNKSVASPMTPTNGNGQPAMNTSQQQLDPKNNNNQPNPPGSEGKPGENGNNSDPNKGIDGKGSHLDAFNDLFKVKVDDKGQPIQDTDPTSEPLLNIDPAKLTEAASKINFMAGISQEDMQKAMSGQDPEAFMKVMNSGIRNAFTAAVTTTTKAAESAIRTNQSRFDSTLDKRVRQVQMHNMQPKNPALNHPAAGPMVAAMKQQIADQNPNLSPEKVQEYAENYFVAFASDLNAGNPDSGNNGKQKQVDPNARDWSNFLA